MLDNISKEAWAIIATTFEEQEKLPAKSSVAANATVVAFSERLLRDIINLADSQQLELVRDFAAGTINKNKFTKLAEQYKQMNADAVALKEDDQQQTAQLILVVRQSHLTMNYFFKD